MTLASPGWLLVLLAIPPLVFITLRRARLMSPPRRRTFLALRIASMGKVLLMAMSLTESGDRPEAFAAAAMLSSTLCMFSAI